MPGVKTVDMEMTKATVTVVKGTDPQTLVSKIKTLGFEGKVAEGKGSGDAEKKAPEKK